MMKKLLVTYLMLTVNLSYAAIAASAILVASSSVKAAETQKVCHDEKGKQVCKTIKIHKKLDGTKVPPK
jgi:hypothetical protein